MESAGTPYYVQEEFCKAFQDRDWDEFVDNGIKNELEFIKKKIAFALFGPDSSEIIDDDIDKEENKNSAEIIEETTPKRSTSFFNFFRKKDQLISNNAIEETPHNEKTVKSKSDESDTKSLTNSDKSNKINDKSQSNDDELLDGYSSEQIKTINMLYNKIIDFRKYSIDNKRVCMAVLYVCCVPLTKDISLEDHAFVPTTEISISPVFKIRKCIKNKEGDIPNCCAYMDDVGRIYQHWDDYLYQNKQPKGVLIVPQNGKYSWKTDENCVMFDYKAVLSPASKIKAKMKTVFNNVSTGVGLGAAGIFATAMFAPVAVPVIIGAGVATVATGIYGASTSAATLIDKSEHDESVSLADSEARKHWFSVTANTFGATAGIASQFVLSGITKGIMIGQATKKIIQVSLIDSVRLALMKFSTNDLMNDDINDQEGKFCNVDFKQLSSSLLFFTHSFINPKKASEFIIEIQTGMPQYKNIMINSNKRKDIKKKHLENLAIQPNIEIVLNLNIIEDKDALFASIFNMNKEQLDERRIEIVFEEDTVSIIFPRKISPEDLMAQERKEMSELQSRVAKGCPINLIVKNINDVKNMSVTIAAQSLIKLYEVCLLNKRFIDCIHPILEEFSNDTFEKVYIVVIEIFESMKTTQFEKFRTVEGTISNILLTIFLFVYKYVKEQSNKAKIDLSVVLAIWFVGGKVDENIVKKISSEILKWLNAQMDAKKMPYLCNICNGIKYFK